MKYSFIVPVYNCDAYLKDCVASILNQSGDHSFEVILVDDGARDRSGQIAEELAGECSRVRTFHKENGGAASARNYGIGKAAGKYILFVDGDDTVDPGLLDAVDSYLIGDEGTLVLYGMSFDYYGGGVLQRTEIMSCGHKGEFPVRNVLENFYSFFIDNALSSACNKVFFREVIQQNRLCFSEGMTLYEDLEFVLRYLMHTKSVYCVDEPYYRYRHDSEKPHLNDRLRDLQSVSRNLSELTETAVELNDAHRIPAAGSSFLAAMADLYMGLLTGNLLFYNYPVEQMKTQVVQYCNTPSFRELLEKGAKLSADKQDLLEKIDAGRFRELRWEFRKRKLISKGKRTVKKLLGRQ